MADTTNTPVEQEYVVTHRVDSRWHDKVKATSIEEAIAKSNQNYADANFGELAQDIPTAYVCAVEDANGNIVYER